MKATNINILDSYLGLLNTLSRDNKLELISRLSQSLKNQPKTKDTSLQELFGAFISEKSEETIIKELRKSKN